MTIKNLITRLAQETGVQDQSAWLFRVQMALRELLNAGDLDLKEITLNLSNYASGESVTYVLPWIIKDIRGIKPADSTRSIELNTPHVGYFDGTYEAFNANWKLLGRTPLDTSITNATRLTLRKRGVEETPVNLTVGGPTSNAAFISEDIELVDSAETTAAFNDVTVFEKTAQNTVDIEMLDAAGNVISLLPNGFYSLPRLKVRLNLLYVPFSYINVLYRPHPPMALGDVIPFEYEDAVFWKCWELRELPAVGVKDPSVFAEKATTAFMVSHDSQHRGVTSYQRGGPVTKSDQGCI